MKNSAGEDVRENVTVSSREEVELSGSRGTAHFAMKWARDARQQANLQARHRPHPVALPPPVTDYPPNVEAATCSHDSHNDGQEPERRSTIRKVGGGGGCSCISSAASSMWCDAAAAHHMLCVYLLPWPPAGPPARLLGWAEYGIRSATERRACAGAQVVEDIKGLKLEWAGVPQPLEPPLPATGSLL